MYSKCVVENVSKGCMLVSAVIRFTLFKCLRVRQGVCHTSRGVAFYLNLTSDPLGEFGKWRKKNVFWDQCECMSTKVHSPDMLNLC